MLREAARAGNIRPNRTGKPPEEQECVAPAAADAYKWARAVRRREGGRRRPSSNTEATQTRPSLRPDQEPPLGKECLRQLWPGTPALWAELRRGNGCSTCFHCIIKQKCLWRPNTKVPSGKVHKSPGAFDPLISLGSSAITAVSLAWCAPPVRRRTARGMQNSPPPLSRSASEILS